MEPTAIQPTPSRNDLPFPEFLDVKRAKLDSESTERRRDKRDIDFTAEICIDMSIDWWWLDISDYSRKLSLPG